MKNRFIRARASSPALSVLSLALAATVHAQGIEINPVVIIGNRFEQPLSSVLPSVTVISRDDIEKTQAPTLADLLHGETGIEFARNGGPGATTSFFMRGQESKSVLVLIDGVPAQRDGSGSLTLTDFPLALVDRVEILRGNAAALYGESAIGGVVSIITRKSQGSAKVYGSLSYGARNTNSAQIGYTGSVNDTRFNLQAGTHRSSGFSSMNSAQNSGINPADDGHNRHFVGIRLDKKIESDMSLGLRASTQRSETNYDSDWYGTSARQQFKAVNNAVGLNVKNLWGDAWTSNLDVSYSDYQYDDLLNGQLTTIFGTTTPNGLYTGHQSAIRWQNQYQINPNWAAVFGMEKLDEKFQQTNVYRSERDTRSIYFGSNAKIDRLDLQVNVRDDVVSVARANSNNKTHITSGLLGLGYALTNTWRLTSTWSTGFRAPTAYETVVNASLLAETHEAKELGIAYNTSTLSARVVYFQTSTRNAIVDKNSSFENVGRAENQGTEASAQASLQGYKVRMNLVRQNPRNVTEGKALTRRARSYGSLDISKSWGNYSAGTRVTASGSRPDFNYSTWPFSPVTLDGYDLWSVYASRKIDENWTARIRLENAFDKQYQLAYGYNTPGRGIYATLQYQPK